MRKIKDIFSWKVIVSLLLILIWIISEIMIRRLAMSLPEQNVAERWSHDERVSAQISVFLSLDAAVSQEQLMIFEHTVDDKLKESSLVSADENNSQKVWADSYSAEGSAIVSYGKKEEQLNVVGVGGDYFIFHPYKLVSGAYFDNSAIQHDYCVLDREAAWKLFGSDDVVGMLLLIKGRPFCITGVVENPSMSIYEQAGMKRGNIYISIAMMNAIGLDNNLNITEYEIVMPNPVKGYALDVVRSNLNVEDKYMEIVENTTRYDRLSMIKHIKNLPTRAIQNKPIAYPYWENVARIREDQISILTLLNAIGVMILGLLFCYKNVWHFLKK